MFTEFESRQRISAATDRLLRKANAYGRFPTPVADLIAAARLTQPKESLLSPSLISSAPRHIRDAMMALRFKVRAVLDREAREIHLAPEIENPGQRTFKQLHEVGHEILEPQDEPAYADDDSTLCWLTDKRVERDANQAAAELLFQRNIFRLMANDYDISIASIIDLSQRFGSSIHAAFRRYVEVSSVPIAGLVLETSPRSLDPLTYKRNETMHSETFTSCFFCKHCWPTYLRMPDFDFLPAIPQASSKPLRFTTRLPFDPCKARPPLSGEMFCNSYRVFVLFWKPRRRLIKRRRVLLRES